MRGAGSARRRNGLFGDGWEGAGLEAGAETGAGDDVGAALGAPWLSNDMLGLGFGYGFLLLKFAGPLFEGGLGLLNQKVKLAQATMLTDVLLPVG